MNKDDSNEASPTAKINKRPAEDEEKNHHRGKGRKIVRLYYDNDSVQQEEESNISDQEEKVQVDASRRITETWIEPMPPQFGFVFPGPDAMVQNFVIYMTVKESTSSPFVEGLKKCAAAAVTQELHNHCFQMDRTRHVTLFEGKFTLGQVRSLYFSGTFSPITLVPTEFIKNWTSGCYLGFTASTEKKLKDLLGKIGNLPKGTIKCDHMSLYRPRGFRGTKNFKEIRDTLRNHDWGTVQGVSIRVKAIGTPYNQCAVLAGE